MRLRKLLMLTYIVRTKSPPIQLTRIVMHRIHLSGAAAALLTFAILGSAPASASLRVVASINPVHSLVSAVMAGVGEPYYLMRDAGSHHTFNLRPSDAAAIQDADVIFLVDETIEVALAGAIHDLARDAHVIELSAAHDLFFLPLREGGAFEEDPHHVHDEDEEDDHGHSHNIGRDHGHSHDDEEMDDHAHSHDDDGHGGGPFDLHLWLDPHNAQEMAHMIADVLAEADPSNAARYRDNAHELIYRLEDLKAEIAADVAPARGKPFIVFHDGYGYFEERFGLAAAGSAVVSAQRSPGVRRIRELRDRVRELGVVCLFDEPQFDRRLVNTIIEGTSVRAGTLDSLGSNMESGPEMYFSLMRNMAASFRDCLAPSAGG